MLKFAIGELGLKPWEFKDMTFQEYQIYAHGYFLRVDRAAIPVRRLYTLIYNSKVPANKQLISPDSIMNHWPLLIDQRSVDMLSVDDKKARLNKAKELTRLQKQKAGVNK